jgi:ribosomal-protein-alanine N-acetyltransferase
VTDHVREIRELRGRSVRLRPFAPDEADDAWQGLALQDESARPRTRAEDWRPTASEGFRKRIERSGKLWRGCLDLAIERRGRVVGLIQARTSPKQTLPAGVFEIGVVVFWRQDRGKGSGREAVELLTTWLFEVAGAERVQAGTEAGNVAMRAVLEDLGFRLEGIMRAFGSLSDGTRADGAMYAAIRPEWREERGRMSS